MTDLGLDEPRETGAVEELARDPASRRSFLKAVGGAGAAGSLALFIAACGEQKQQITPGGSNAKTGAGVGTDRFGKGDAGIAIYALTLEYVEADLYRQILDSGKLKGKGLALAQRFSEHEMQHVNALEAVVRELGEEPPGAPKTSFTLENESDILKLASQFEGLGAAAYLGEAARISASKEGKQLLAVALSIHSVEARHSAALSIMIGQPASPDGAFAQSQSAANVLTALQPYFVGSQ
jgi:hypothetical protein